MTVKISPSPRRQFVNASGVPYSGAKLFYYAAGTTTKQNTYTTSTGVTANSNPIVLDSSGRTPYAVWFTSGLLYKEVLAPSTDTDPPASPIYTEDNLSGINDSAAAANLQWAASALTPTYTSTTTFTVAGDQTTELSVGRRLQLTTSGGTVYGRISVSAYVSVTTITLVMDAGQVLDVGLSSFNWSILTGTNHAIPKLTNTYLTDLGIAGITANNALTGTLSVAGATTLSSTLAVTGVTTIADGTAEAPSLKFLAGGTQLGLHTVAGNDFIGVTSRGLPAVEIGGSDSGGQVGNVIIHANTTTGAGGELDFLSSRGTAAIPTILQSGDIIGELDWAAYDGTAYRYTAIISATVNGTPGAGDMPTALNFWTTPDGSATRALRMKIDQAGNLQFNSGYGSAATAYGCRAWVNFDGSGTPAIRASGNVSSITDNGTGDYTVNFTTAIVDASYSVHITGQRGASSSFIAGMIKLATTPTTSAVNVIFMDAGGTPIDPPICCAAIFR